MDDYFRCIHGNLVADGCAHHFAHAQSVLMDDDGDLEEEIITLTKHFTIF